MHVTRRIPGTIAREDVLPGEVFEYGREVRIAVHSGFPIDQSLSLQYWGLDPATGELRSLPETAQVVTYPNAVIDLEPTS